jgi:hypothetical protein
MSPCQFVGRQNQLEAAWVASQVEDHRWDAVAHQVAYGPGANAAQRTGFPSRPSPDLPHPQHPVIISMKLHGAGRVR